MDTQGLIREVDAEIERLTQARNLLTNRDAGRAGRGSGRSGPRHMSADARQRISMAQKRRWALRKRGRNRAAPQQSGSQASVAIVPRQQGRRRMSAAGRARIAAAQKARWAAARARKGQSPKKK